MFANQVLICYVIFESRRVPTPRCARAARNYGIKLFSNFTHYSGEKSHGAVTSITNADWYAVCAVGAWRERRRVVLGGVHVGSVAILPDAHATST
ncbi:hypothetical protein EVAR_38655_1 [Eumeta japonica]|uniref:Uncharacterized protein n=1 Tax=Eumeta variegata TaxID=151549 RepID=A0A4C1XXU2_EUMVA|nr:hypothetical protein EVAR_38655_1 [Eumeta japonica]